MDAQAAASVVAKIMVLGNAVSDQWFSVSPYVYNSICPDPLNITATPCGEQLVSNVVSIVVVISSWALQLLVGTLAGVNGAYVY